jgi:hypothetical protein
MRDVGSGGEGKAYSDSEAEEGECYVAALNHLGFDTEDNSSIQEDGKGVEINKDGEGHHI